MTAWKIITDPTLKLNLSSLIDHYENEGVEIVAEKAECTQIVVKLTRKNICAWDKFYPTKGTWNELASYISTYIPLWVSKFEDMVLRWLPIVEKLNGHSVKQAIPSKYAHKFDAPDSRYAVKYLPLAPYRKRLQEDANQLKLSVVKSGFDTRMGIVAAKKEDAILVKRNARRVRGIRGPKKYLDIRNSIEKEVKEKWKSGVPITRHGIYKYLKLKCAEGDFHDKFLSKVEQADKLSNFVTRTLQYFGFCVHEIIIFNSRTQR